MNVFLRIFVKENTRLRQMDPRHIFHLTPHSLQKLEEQLKQ